MESPRRARRTVRQAARAIDGRGRDAPWRTRGHRRRGGRLYGGSRCGGAARWLGRGRRTARTQDGRIAGRTESSRAVGTSALWKSDRAATGRADEQPGPRFRTLAARSDFQRDRKSTRLNSSHLVISYAVFCLKKKKKRQESVTQYIVI